MSNGQPVPTNLPSSYASVPYTEIRISHHPASSAEPTPVLICTLHRPKNNNAFTDIMTDELEHFFGLASIDDRVKCIVMTGHGKMFCAGQDLQQGFKLQGNGKNETDKTHRDGGGRVSLAIHNCTKPTIAAINGHAVGVGITMTLACVMRVVWSKAKIGFVFSQRGVVMEGCSSFFLPRLIGHARTLQLVTTGATIPATAKQLDGLFSDLCDRQEDVLPKALEIADGIASNTSTVSTYMIREMLWRGPSSAEEAHLLESRVMGHMRGSADNDEAVAAFLEKRKAVFTATMQHDSPPVHPWFTPVNTKNPAVANLATTGKPRL
ncbi:Putative enoyl-CoA hydratase/isomerase, ClpP/crotonase-like domain superfamily [Septoria linicola]|uniref:Enoyl-CoA hydratase/isomerase, ClpP/crotonase-like domain superfamily n=1 Tax=Septoria linicola TaxID=215465 RepID=A0A9Q9AS90_9PEZI|nr:putative enoyl-CoA hydratase/isomerase, ClpP/crotonase-like domain superfamily [Septoria linicola]USW51102.1 Putative enoyl-CoA hydratase/isomerase, ClpP/crotonase-like domain superfamily [Septoria linicola]